MNAAGGVIDSYDAVLFDLDGVIYLGPIAVPGAAEGIARLHDRGTKIGFVTNNAARPPTVVAEHLVELGIPATAADVVTSAQAAAHLLITIKVCGCRKPLARVGLRPSIEQRVGVGVAQPGHRER